MDEAWHLLTHRLMDKEQFQEWLDQRAWDKADAVLEDMEAGEEVEKEAEDPAQVAIRWERVMRQQARGESFADMLPLDQESDVGEEEPPVKYDPTPTINLTRTLQDLRAKWCSLEPSLEEEVTYVPLMDLNQFDPVLTGTPLEDEQQIISANSHFKGILN
jgi:hypothetical protein